MNIVKDTRPIMVSIRCMTYNHEKYIRDALEGFVMQKTNFRFEAIIHDDASTDGTAAIIREYAEKYPDIIKPIYETENQYSKHDGSLRRIMDEACKGKYIAYCEGDDYWIDPLKLQKQVDFLETHPEIVYSCHPFVIFEQNENVYKEGWNNFFRLPENKNKTEFVFDRDYPFERCWITSTLTQVIRRDVLNPTFCNQFKYARDVHNIYSVLSQGKGVCHNFIGGVYRISNVGIYGPLPLKTKYRTDYEVWKEFYSKVPNRILRRKVIQNVVLCMLMNDFNFPINIITTQSFFIAVWKKMRIALSLKTRFIRKKYNTDYNESINNNSNI